MLNLTKNIYYLIKSTWNAFADGSSNVYILLNRRLWHYNPIVWKEFWRYL